MQQITFVELEKVSGGVSKSTIYAGARLLGRALLTGVSIGSGAGIILGVTMIGYDLLYSPE